MSPGSVAVPAHNSRLGERTSGFRFELLGTNPKISDSLAPTCRAALRNRATRVTQMANEQLTIGMIDKRRVTPLASNDVAAIAAENKGGISPTIEKQDGLLAHAQREVDRLAKRG